MGIQSGVRAFWLPFVVFGSFCACGGGDTSSDGGGSGGSGDSSSTGGDPATQAGASSLGGGNADTGGALPDESGGAGFAGSLGGGTAGDGASSSGGTPPTGGTGGTAGAGGVPTGGVPTGGVPTGGVPTGGVPTGGSSGDGGSGGAGGLPSTGCPDAPPTTGDTCSLSGRTCAYEDCAETGRSIATCQDGTWTTETGPCEALVCPSAAIVAGTCDVGRVCIYHQTGVPSVQCVDNTCGAGPVGCDCLSGCDGACSVTGSTTDGITIYCTPCGPSGCV